MLLNETCKYEKTPQLLFKKIFLKNIFVRKFYNSEKKKEREKRQFWSISTTANNKRDKQQINENVTNVKNVRMLFWCKRRFKVAEKSSSNTTNKEE